MGLEPEPEPEQEMAAPVCVPPTGLREAFMKAKDAKKDELTHKRKAEENDTDTDDGAGSTEETAYVFECVGGCGAKTNGSQFCHTLYCPKMHMEEEEKDMNENTNLSCVDAPLKRKCEEEGGMPNSKRVRVDDDSSYAWLTLASRRRWRVLATGVALRSPPARVR